MMRKLAVVADYLDDSHRTHIEKMAGDAGFTVDYFTEGHLPQDRAGEYEVIYGTVPPKELKAATALRWFCCSYAGMDQWKDDALYHSPEVMLSNSSGAYGVTISEHMVMVTLMLLRQMPTVQEWMRRHDWSNEKPPMRSVCGSRVTVLGTGDIGTSFARRVKAMGAKTVVGVSRSGRRVDDAYDAMYTTAQLDQVLPETEILAMALPGTAETEGILSRSRIALLPKEAVVVNVGRGTAIDQDALMEALNAGRIAGAALDVVVPEPLPREHPLWSTRNLLLTPICPHSTRSSSYVLSPEHVITVEAADANRKFVYLSVDGGKAFSLKSGDQVRVSTSKYTTRLVRLSKKSFCEILDKKMGTEASKK